MCYTLHPSPTASLLLLSSLIHPHYHNFFNTLCHPFCLLYHHHIVQKHLLFNQQPVCSLWSSFAKGYLEQFHLSLVELYKWGVKYYLDLFSVYYVPRNGEFAINP